MATTSLHNLSPADLADEFGDINGRIKELQDRAKALREALLLVDSSDREPDGSVAGERYSVSSRSAMRWTLNTAALKRQIGQDGYDRLCTAAVVTTVTVAPRKAA